jgi:hypothetical protein
LVKSPCAATETAYDGPLVRPLIVALLDVGPVEMLDTVLS